MITFKVTNKHIKNGARNSPFSCPIALAIKEGGKYSDVTVAESLYNIKCYTSGLLTKYFLHSKKSLKFVRDFDCGKKVKSTVIRLKEAQP